MYSTKHAQADLGETYIDGAQYHWMEPYVINTTTFMARAWANATLPKGSLLPQPLPSATLCKQITNLTSCRTAPPGPQPRQAAGHPVRQTEPPARPRGVAPVVGPIDVVTRRTQPHRRGAANRRHQLRHGLCLRVGPLHEPD